MTTPDLSATPGGKSRRRWRIGLIALAVVLGIGAALFGRSRIEEARAAAASGAVIVTREYQISGAQRPGDLVAAAEAIQLDNVIVTGNVSLAAESVLVSGQISGDLTILAPNVLIDNASIGGALHILGDNVQVASSQIAGESLIDAENLTFSGADFAVPPAICTGNLQDDASGRALAECPPSTVDPFQDVIALRERAQASPGLSIVIGALGLIGISAGISALVAAIVPERATRVARGIRRHPGTSTAIGVGVYALAIGLTVAQTALIGLVPVVGAVTLLVYIIALLLLLVTFVSGWVGLALLIGSRLHRASPAPAAAALGGAIVGMAVVIVALLPVSDGIALGVLALITVTGTGAAFGTRLGASGRQAARAVEASA